MPLPSSGCFGVGLLPIAPSASPDLSDLFWSLKRRRDGRWSSAHVGTHTRYCFHQHLIPPFFPKLYFSASCSWIKCFLPLNHIMHLAEALVRFSLWGIVCVKPTELKVLLHLLFPTPGRQRRCRAFCILAAKCWKVRWRQKVQGLATLSFGITGLHTSTIICEAGTLASETFYIWDIRTAKSSKSSILFIHQPQIINPVPKITCSEALSKWKGRVCLCFPGAWTRIYLTGKWAKGPGLACPVHCFPKRLQGMITPVGI